MLIKKYSKHQHHHKNISNNIQIKQCSSSPTPVLSDELTPATVTVAESSCNCTANDLHHLFLKLYKSWNTAGGGKKQQQHLRTRMWWCSSSVVMVALGVILLPLAPQSDAVGYSYTRFSGPVSGPEHRVYVHNGAATGHRGVDANADDDHHHDEAARLDYVAKPEYEFAYGVEDAQAHILHNRNEMRDGDAVKGVYSVVDPDGTLRIVKYTADDINGFQAEVIMNGISAIHGQLQPDTPTTISHQSTHNTNNNDDGHYNYHQRPEDNSNYNHRYHPSYYYPTPVHPGNPTPTTIHDSNNNNDNNNNDYDDNQDYNNNENDYLPQYEVHERPNKDEEDDKEDGEDEHDGKQDNKKAGNGGKKKDYDDDDEDDDGDDDDDYDYSEELVDYDEAVKNHEASNESDEYY